MNPTPEQFQTVIDTLESVLPKAQHEGHLDMKEAYVSSFDHKCGTVHCVAGWYAIGAGLVGKGYCGFSVGAEHMARELGFRDSDALKSWAYDNPEIWGNDNGKAMFVDSHAWSGAETLADCVAHLEGVRDRLETCWQSKSNSNNNSNHQETHYAYTNT